MDTETIADPKPTLEEKVEIVQTETAAQTPAETQETEQQINWRKFREQREIERKQKEAAEKRAQEKEAEAQALKAAMDALLNKSPPRQPDNHYDNQNDQYEVSDDEKIQRKVEEAIAKKEAEYERVRREREVKEYPQRLLSDFRDFNEVCSTENLDYLEFHHPEIAAAFKYTPDGYDKWANIYKLTKKLIPNAGNVKETKKAETNFKKPQSMAVPGSTPTGDTAPIYLDDKRRADNWARMQKVMKGG